MKCFYHSADLDGHCSGAIVKKFRPEAELCPIDYGMPFPFGQILNTEPVYMVDFSLQPFEDMIDLNRRCNLVWIDHHKSAIESEKEIHPEEGVIKGMRDSKFGACELAWKFFDDKLNDSWWSPPKAVLFLGIYDSWRHNNDNDCLNFQYGMRQYDTDPRGGMDRLVWDRLLSKSREAELEVQGIIDAGHSIRGYQYQQDKAYLKTTAFEVVLDGLKCIATNKMFTGSQAFASMWDQNKYDAMLSFGWKNGSWTISLYTDKPGVDVSVIAKAHGGGGHKQACGFQCKELPWQIKDDKR